MTKKIIIILAIVILGLVAFVVLSKPATSTQKSSDSNVTLENGVQIVHMSESAKGYTPNSFTITKGIPVKWEIDSSTDRTCANVVLVPEYKIQAFLKPGKNVVNFTPQKIGVTAFTCSMGMYRGVFNVVE